MEFDELQKIWDSQSNQTMYAINEQALYNRILSKKNRANHVTEFSERLLIIVNILMGAFMIQLAFGKNANLPMTYLLGAWMLGVAVYFIVRRLRRKAADKRFDRSMRGELDHAISLATYQVQLSQFGRWNMLPMALLLLVGLWGSGNTIWLAVGLVLFFVMTFFVSRWEHNIYKNRKRELEMLKEKLEL